MGAYVEYVGENPNNLRENGMTQDSKVIAAVDIGTTKVCTIVARQEVARQFSVLSYSVVPSRGMEKGIVTDISEAEESIRSSVSEATDKAEETVTSAYVGITGSHVSFENRSDRIDWAATKGVITRSGPRQDTPDCRRGQQTAGQAGDSCPAPQLHPGRSERDCRPSGHAHEAYGGR